MQAEQAPGAAGARDDRSHTGGGYGSRRAPAGPDGGADAFTASQDIAGRVAVMRIQPSWVSETSRSSQGA